MSFIDDIGSAASSVGSAIGGAVEDVAGAVGDAAGAVNKALGGVPGDVIDGAVDLLDNLPDPVTDALKGMALFAVAATPALGLGALVAGAAGSAVVPHIPTIVDKLEGQDLKRDRADRAMAEQGMIAEKARMKDAEAEKARKEDLQRKASLEEQGMFDEGMQDITPAKL